MIDQAVERFERQLTHQIGGFRDDLREGEAALHTELRILEAALRADLAAVRNEIRDGHAALQVETRGVGAALADETATLRATLHGAMADQRITLLKWVFALWLGQLFAIGALMILLLRGFGP